MTLQLITDNPELRLADFGTFVNLHGLLNEAATATVTVATAGPAAGLVMPGQTPGMTIPVPAGTSVVVKFNQALWASLAGSTLTMADKIVMPVVSIKARVFKDQATGRLTQYFTASVTMSGIEVTRSQASAFWNAGGFPALEQLPVRDYRTGATAATAPAQVSLAPANATVLTGADIPVNTAPVPAPAAQAPAAAAAPTFG